MPDLPEIAPVFNTLTGIDIEKKFIDEAISIRKLKDIAEDEIHYSVKDAKFLKLQSSSQHLLYTEFGRNISDCFLNL